MGEGSKDGSQLTHTVGIGSWRFHLYNKSILVKCDSHNFIQIKINQIRDTIIQIKNVLT